MSQATRVNEACIANVPPHLALFPLIEHGVPGSSRFTVTTLLAIPSPNPPVLYFPCTRGQPVFSWVETKRDRRFFGLFWDNVSKLRKWSSFTNFDYYFNLSLWTLLHGPLRQWQVLIIGPRGAGLLRRA